MPAYNAERFIQESIDAVRNQTFINWELIITDDGSTDSTNEIIKRNSQLDSRIICLTQKNAKQAAARNTAIKSARSELIGFIDADDIWVKTKLESQLKIINQNPDIDLVYSGGWILNEYTGEKYPYKSEFGFYSGPEMYKKLYGYNLIPNLSVILKKRWVSIVGYQNESQNIVGCEDWDYWLRLANSGANFYGVDDCLFSYRVHDLGMSRNMIQMQRAEVNTLYNNLNNNQNKQFVKERVGGLIISLLPKLVSCGMRDVIFEQMKILLKINLTIRYVVLFLYFKIFVRAKIAVVKKIIDPFGISSVENTISN